MSHNNAKQQIKKVLLSKKLKAHLCQIIDETTSNLSIRISRNSKELLTINLN